MPAISPDPYLSSQPPRSEQLKRLRQLGVHLKGFLSRYCCEPQTRDRFQKREALKDRLKAWENKCRRLAQQEWQDSMSARMREEMANLNCEFKLLETQVNEYLRDSTA